MKKEESIKNRIVEDFAESAFCPPLVDAGIDIADVSYDALGEMIFGVAYEGFLKNIPIVKTVMALGETAWNVYQAHLLKKQLAFIEMLAKGKADPAAIEKRKKALEKHEKWVYEEIETTLVYLERYSHVEKAQIHALLYADLVNEKIVYNRFMECLDVIDRLFMSDILSFCKPLATGKSVERTQSQCDRLQSLGLFHAVITTRVGESTIDRYTETELGRYIFQLIRTAYQYREARLA